MVAFTPALAYVAGSGGNFVSCIALPRKTVQSIYIQEGKRDTTVGEADAGWRFMGVTGALGCASLLIADKNASGDDKKMLNMAIAGTSAAAAGLFVAHPFCKDIVKPEMRVANLAVNLGVGAFALKAALGK